MAQWPQFGGPRRDFTCETVPLKIEWPSDGPKRLWSRPFGQGYSGVIVDHGKIFSTYRTGDSEIIAALDGHTGKALWEHRYPDPIDKSQYASRYGYGPRSTPLISGSRLIAVSFNGRVNCLDVKTGKLLWTVDLVERYKAKLPRWGYANSPIAWKNTFVLPAGGPGAAFVALDPATGRTLWQRHDFENSYGSPIEIGVDGQRQFACLMAREVVGIDPENGDLLWQHPHEGQWHNSIPNPIWGNDNSLLVTSEGDAGTRLLKLARSGGQTNVQQSWTTKKFRVVHRNIIRIGNRAYGSSGDFGASIFSAIDLQAGEIVWQDRSIGRAGILQVGDKLVMLEETGDLLLATIKGDGVDIHARARLCEDPAWTIPTLVGRKLFLRDNKTIQAVELP